MTSSAASGWHDYLARFHDERPGITEDLLARSADESGRTPYDWLAEAVPPGARVLDLACGSGAAAGSLRPETYLGVDVSSEELRRARRLGLPVARADAVRLPLPDGCVDVVVCSMALQLLPLAETLAEVRRVLRRGGLLVASVPAGGPLPLRDALRWARLLLALRRRRLTYPNDDALEKPGDVLRAAGLTPVSDESAGFRYDLASGAAADRLLDSLYLPGAPDARVSAGRRVVRAWVGRSVTVPLRRLVARV